HQPTPTLFPYTTLFRSLLTLPSLEAEVLVQPLQRPIKPRRLRGREAAQNQDHDQGGDEPQHEAIVAPSGLASSPPGPATGRHGRDRKSTRLNSSHDQIS